MSHVQFRIKLANKCSPSRAGIDLTSSETSPQLPSDAHLHDCHFVSKIVPRSSGKPSQHECIVCTHKTQSGRNTQHTIVNNVKQCYVQCHALNYIILIQIKQDTCDISKCSQELALILLCLHLLHDSLQMHAPMSIISLAKQHLVQVESHNNMNVLSVVIRNKMVEIPQHTIVNNVKQFYNNKYTYNYTCTCIIYVYTVVPQASAHLYASALPHNFVLKEKCQFPM